MAFVMLAVMLAVSLVTVTLVSDAEESEGASQSKVGQATSVMLGALITIEETSDGWKLTGSGPNAVLFAWAISADQAAWRYLGDGASLTLKASDYPDGTYWVLLTAASEEGVTGTALWSFTVSGSKADHVTSVIPEAAISIEKTDDGWRLNGSGTNAVAFAWYVLEDGKAVWSCLGAGESLELDAADYPDGKYWVMLTVVSETGNVATALDGFTVGGGKDGGILSFLKEHPLAVIGAIVALVVLILVARWFL